MASALETEEKAGIGKETVAIDRTLDIRNEDEEDLINSQEDLLNGHFQTTFDISDVKDEDLYNIMDSNHTIMNIEWDERINMNQNKDRKKKIKEKLLQQYKGKFVVDYKKVWNQQDGSCESIPTDIIMILKNDTNLDKFKNEMIAKLKQLGFTLKISTISGGESINFESTVQTENKSVAFRIPVKLYIRNKKLMVQGTPDSQTFFIKHFRDLNNKSEPDESRKNTISEEQKPDKVQDSLAKPTLSLKPLSSSRLDIPSSTLPSVSQSSLPSPTSSTPFTTPKDKTSKFLERSGAVLSPARIAQIGQIKDTVTSLESNFIEFKLNTEAKLSGTVSQEFSQDKIHSLTQSHKTEIRMLQSRCSDLELAKEVMMNRIKTLEDQNKQQFRQIVKLEESVNTLTTLVKEVFKKNITNEELNEVQPNESSVVELNGEETISPIIPTSNKFNPLEAKSVNHKSNETETTRSINPTVDANKPDISQGNQPNYHQLNSQSSVRLRPKPSNGLYPTLHNGNNNVNDVLFSAPSYQVFQPRPYVPVCVPSYQPVIQRPISYQGHQFYNTPAHSQKVNSITVPPTPSFHSFQSQKQNQMQDLSSPKDLDHLSYQKQPDPVISKEL